MLTEISMVWAKTKPDLMICHTETLAGLSSLPCGVPNLECWPLPGYAPLGSQRQHPCVSFGCGLPLAVALYTYPSPNPVQMPPLQPAFPNCQPRGPTFSKLQCHLYLTQGRSSRGQAQSCTLSIWPAFVGTTTAVFAWTLFNLVSESQKSVLYFLKYPLIYTQRKHLLKKKKKRPFGYFYPITFQETQMSLYLLF